MGNWCQPIDTQNHPFHLKLTLFAGADQAQVYTLRTAKALAMTALDVLFSPGVIDKVKEEFKEAKLREEREPNRRQLQHEEAEINKEHETATV